MKCHVLTRLFRSKGFPYFIAIPDLSIIKTNQITKTEKSYLANNNIK